ncbi:hypothetical protein [Hymenobacter sp. DG25A]|uniref:hypothetical protein n=1 Tax=Hymenobacter sp. DG25A TaxID=1385663 RepID=UPI000ACD0FE5|nr:hypothetical protein [Hymenobacter sp. DG25A]
MKGYIYSLYRGADPGRGFVMTDPIFEGIPTLGACMPNIRRLVSKGDYIFTISGRVPNVKQYIIGGFEVENKLNALAALDYFPDKALSKAEDGSFRGNIIVNRDGSQVQGDYHTNFEKRLDNYVVGKNPLYINKPDQIELARVETLDFLKRTFKSDGDNVFDVLGRWRKLDESQVKGILEWLRSIKQAS